MEKTLEKTHKCNETKETVKNYTEQQIKKKKKMFEKFGASN